MSVKLTTPPASITMREELQYITRAVFVPRLVNEIFSSEPMTPPTRWERLKWWFEDWRERFSRAWRVLRGHDDYDAHW